MRTTNFYFITQLEMFPLWSITKTNLFFNFVYVSVSLGGVANLFLGFSLLSVIEFIYWIIRIAIILAWKRYKRMRKITKIIPLMQKHKNHCS